jgi:hypothetical protein
MQSNTSIVKTTDSKSISTQSTSNISGNEGFLSVMPYVTNPIQIYTAELWNTLSERDTAITYKQALAKTWKLLRYLLALLFYMFLLGVAVIIATWGIGFNLGASLQKWLNNSGEGRTPEEFFSILLTAVISPTKKLVEWANKYLKKYLPNSHA